MLHFQSFLVLEVENEDTNCAESLVDSKSQTLPIVIALEDKFLKFSSSRFENRESEKGSLGVFYFIDGTGKNLPSFRWKLTLDDLDKTVSELLCNTIVLGSVNESAKGE